MNAPPLHDLHHCDTMVNTLLRTKLRLHPRSSAADMRRLLTNVNTPLILVYDAAMRGLVRGLPDTVNSERQDLRTWATHRWTNRNKIHAVSDESKIQEALIVISTHFVKLTKDPTDYVRNLTYVVKEYPTQSWLNYAHLPFNIFTEASQRYPPQKPKAAKRQKNHQASWDPAHIGTGAAIIIVAGDEVAVWTILLPMP